MAKTVNPQGYIEVDDNGTRKPLLTALTAGSKINPQGYLYQEELVDGVVGIKPIVVVEGSGGGGSSAVTSVNGQTGDVVVTASSIGAITNTDLNTALSTKADLVSGKVPASQLPSYVDDVIEVNDFASLPVTGEQGKIYITIDTNKTYRWSGSTYIEISAATDLTGYATEQYVNTTIDNIEIGGRNYIIGSILKDNTLGGQKIFDLSEPLVIGETYTLSFYYKTAKTDRGMSVGFGSPWTGGNNFSLPPSLDYVEYKTTFNALKADSVFFNFDTVIYAVSIKYAKLEKGNKPTDWTPAPEDFNPKVETGFFDIDISVGVNKTVLINNNYFVESIIVKAETTITKFQCVITDSLGNAINTIVAPTDINSGDTMFFPISVPYNKKTNENTILKINCDGNTAPGINVIANLKNI